MFGTVQKSPPSVGASALQKKTDELRHKSLPPSSAAKYRRNFDCFFCFSKETIQKKHQNYEEPPFVCEFITSCFAG
jgi:hypothetical protein